MATGVVLQVGASCLGLVSCAAASSSSSSLSSCNSQSRSQKVHQLPGFLKVDVKRLPLRSEDVKAFSSRRFDAFEEPSASDWEMEERGPGEAATPQSWDKQEISPEAGAIVLSSSSSSSTSLQPLSKDAAMGIILSAAGTTAGWTTGSGLEGPAYSMNMAGSEMPSPIVSKSPRRRMRVAFTCNVCGHRSIRAINPRAYTDGTVFVQCEGCDVFHKLVDNLKLFHELKGRIYRGYECMEVGYDQYYDFLG